MAALACALPSLLEVRLAALVLRCLQAAQHLVLTVPSFDPLAMVAAKGCVGFRAAPTPLVGVGTDAAGSLRCCVWSQLKACAMMLSALFAEFS